MTLALQAARRGLATLLLERGDFGGETTWNSLRIVHGGLRYLQQLDLPRYRESVAERRWLLRHFPDLVEPLPCLLPLYAPPRGGRLRRRAPLRAALAADALLGRRRNEEVREDRMIPPGRLLGHAETVELFPGVDRDGLRGSALWHDAVVADSHRLVIEFCAGPAGRGRAPSTMWRRRSCGWRGPKCGGCGRWTASRGGASRSGRRRSRAAPDPGRAGSPAASTRTSLPELFQPLLAFNLLLDREPPAEDGRSRGGGRLPGARRPDLVPAAVPGRDPGGHLLRSDPRGVLF